VSEDQEYKKQYAAIGAEIRRGMTIRSMSSVELASRLGISASRLSNFRRGHTVPAHDMVAAISDILSWGRLIELSVRLRARTCGLEGCGAYFQDNSLRLNRVYCSQKCLTANYMRVRRGDVTVRYAITTHRLELHVDRVAKMCGICAPDGACWDATCPLSDVSPLMLSRYARVSDKTRPVVLTRTGTGS
jgi:transcriptional regulator with XRE-family HTH domain